MQNTEIKQKYKTTKTTKTNVQKPQQLQKLHNYTILIIKYLPKTKLQKHYKIIQNNKNYKIQKTTTNKNYNNTTREYNILQIIANKTSVTFSSFGNISVNDSITKPQIENIRKYDTANYTIQNIQHKYNNKKNNKQY